MIENKIIQNSLIYYDKNYQKYKKYLDRIAFKNITASTNDIDRSTILFTDENNKKVLKAKFEYIGIYYNTANLWVWAWADPDIKKNANYMSRKILQYGLDINTGETKHVHQDDDEYFDVNKFLKSELITSRFNITNELQLEIHIAIANYLAKTPISYHTTGYFTKDKKNYKRHYMFLFDIETFD
jgi:DUF4097 and DUF4098 domain-containing protein YvlB